MNTIVLQRRQYKLELILGQRVIRLIKIYRVIRVIRVIIIRVIRVIRCVLTVKHLNLVTQLRHGPHRSLRSHLPAPGLYPPSPNTSSVA